MPLALRDLQAAFAAHLAEGADRPDLLAEVAGDTIPAAARLGVYRHHVFESLGLALATTFPTVQALVGADFFRRLSHDFIAQSPPTQPVLVEYGAGLPAFVAGYEPARGLPYLADIARLDWALNFAFYSPEGERLTEADLAAVEIERLPSMSVELAPGVDLISSPYPLDRIWAVSQPGATGGTVELGSGGCLLLVVRRSEDAGFFSLSRGEAAFVSALGRGVSLEQGAGVALQADPAFDLSAFFARLLALKVLAALR